MSASGRPGEAIPPDVVALADYEAHARVRLDDNAWAYLAGGAADEITLRANRSAWDDIRLLHIGGDAGEPVLGELARSTGAACPHYRWLGPRPHEETLECIRAAHVLVHTSAMEGGAHVLLEAVRCGTPVLASRVPGNVGMLGADYAGYFPHGNAGALVALLRACRVGQSADNPAAGVLQHLGAQCAQRDALFEPAAERAALLQLVHELQIRP